MPSTINVAAVWTLCAATAGAALTSEGLHERRSMIEGHVGSVNAVAFSPDGQSLATAGFDAVARLWNVAVMDVPIQRRELHGHFQPVYAAAFSPDGQLLATGGLDKTIRVWRASDGKALRTIVLPHAVVFSLAFSTDSRVLASGGDDGLVRLWDPAGGKQLGALAGHRGNVYAVTYSRQGLLASGGDDKEIRIWDFSRSTAAARVVLSGHKGLVSGLAFSSDGGRLASSSWDRSVKVWDVPQARLWITLNGHTGPATSVAFTADGQTLVSGGRDKARFWDPDTGIEKSLLDMPDDGVLSVSVSPDGLILASGNVDGTARLYLLRGEVDPRYARPVGAASSHVRTW